MRKLMIQRTVFFDTESWNQVVELQGRVGGKKRNVSEIVREAIKIRYQLEPLSAKLAEIVSRLAPKDTNFPKKEEYTTKTQ